MSCSETRGQGISCVYAWLPKKKRTTYEQLFRVVGDFSLTSIMTDFERAVFRAVATVFPDAHHTGCRFHRNAAIFSQVGSKSTFPGVDLQVPCSLLRLCSSYSWLPQFGNSRCRRWGSGARSCLGRLFSRNWFWYVHAEYVDWATRWTATSLPFTEEKVQTNNILERFDRTLNSLVGTSSNVWTIQQAFVKRMLRPEGFFWTMPLGLTSTITLEGDREVWTITKE